MVLGLMGSDGQFSLGVSHAVVVRWQAGAGAGTWVGMAGDWVNISPLIGPLLS